MFFIRFLSQFFDVFKIFLKKRTKNSFEKIKNRKNIFGNFLDIFNILIFKKKSDLLTILDFEKKFFFSPRK